MLSTLNDNGEDDGEDDGEDNGEDDGKDNEEDDGKDNGRVGKSVSSITSFRLPAVPYRFLHNSLLAPLSPVSKIHHGRCPPPP